MRAADALFEALKAEGVKHIFGIPGGANLPIYDALYDADFEHSTVAMNPDLRSPVTTNLVSNAQLLIGYPTLTGEVHFPSSPSVVLKIS